MRELLKSNISKLYVVGMLLVIVIVLLGYYSYAMFTVKKEKSNAISIVTGNLVSTIESSDLDSNRSLVVKAGETKTITVILRNKNVMNAKFNFYYEAVDGISIQYDSSKDAPPDKSGYVIGSEESKVYKLQIHNSTGTDQIITFGSEVGLDYNELAFPNGKKVITDSVYNYCTNNGFNKLSDCMLVMENYAENVDSAMSYITNKGTPDFSKIAPTVNYKEETTEVTNENGVISTTSHFTLGQGYSFNSSTGMFTLTNYHNNPLTDEYLNYYTCGGTNSTSASCATMYQVKSYKTTTDSNGNVTYRVTSAIKHSYKTIEDPYSEGGLYKTNDDLGDSYYYRGNVKNNYVSFAGFIWRIVRRNGDGSVRLIYAGTKMTDSGSATSIGTSKFNEKYWDPTYVGYMYSEGFSLNETNTTVANYTNFSENTNYYYGTSYHFDEATKKFSISGEKTYGLWKNKYQEAIASYPYTCFSTSENGTCNVLIKLVGYTNNYTAQANLISYSSTSYEGTLRNTTNSTIKTTIDDWYKTNILNKKNESGNSYASYLSDGIFCNDRSLATGSGYLLVPSTTYGPYKRLISSKAPSLKSLQTVDKFSVSSSFGNENLIYPVGLLTADEVSMAGGLYASVNTQYYLYTGQTYWLSSPYNFRAASANAEEWIVNSAGRLTAYWVGASYGVRPVINLSADIQVTVGDGTVENPFEVSL